jgi:hypothetical protein
MTMNKQDLHLTQKVTVKPEAKSLSQGQVYAAPQLFVIGDAVDLVQGTQWKVYRDLHNAWYTYWPHYGSSTD